MLQMYFIELSLEIVAEIADSRLDIFIFMFCISLIFFLGGGRFVDSGLDILHLYLC